MTKSKHPNRPKRHREPNSTPTGKIVAPGTIEVAADPSFPFLNPNQTVFSFIVDEDGAKQLLRGVVPLYVADQVVETLTWMRQTYKHDFYPELTRQVEELTNQELEGILDREASRQQASQQADQNLGGPAGSAAGESTGESPEVSSAAGAGIGDSLANRSK